MGTASREQRQPSEVTRLLQAWHEGDRDALHSLVPLMYAELHRAAKGMLFGEHRAPSMQATALISEAYLRFAGVARVRWKDRSHFLAVATQLMRRILVENARAKGRQKRGRHDRLLGLNESLDGGPVRPAVLVALDDALELLARMDPRKAQVVELRFFGGLSVEETATVLRISPQSVMRDWRLARAWLSEEIERGR
jgi:RNA polymerase sigma factor (TIGR02999 family)